MPSDTAQFSYLVSLSDGREAEVWVDRSQSRLAVRLDRYGFAGELPRVDMMSAKGKLFDHEEKVYIEADPAASTQRARAEEIWRLYQRDELLRIAAETLWSKGSGFLKNSTFEVRPGGDFAGQKTHQLVLWSRKNLGDSRIRIPLGSRQDGATLDVITDLGLVLDGGFSKLRVTQLEVGPVEPGVFETPTGYTEKWSDDELEATKPKTPFDKNPPAGYVHIGGDWFRELDWEGQRVSVSWQKWMQDANPKGQFMVSMFLYRFSEDDAEKITRFATTSNEKFHFPKFQEFEDTLREGAQQARLAPFHAVLRKGTHLLSVELRWFAPNQPGERTPPEDDYSRKSFEEILNRLAAGL